MDVIRYMNCCIVEFGRRLGLEPKRACRYFICTAVLNYWIKIPSRAPASFG